MKLKSYQRRILFLLLVLSIILCGISFIIPTVEVAYSSNTKIATFFLWGGQWNNLRSDSPYPQLYLYPSMIGIYKQVIDTSAQFASEYNGVVVSIWDFNTLIIGHIFLTLTLFLFVFSLIMGIKGLFHMYRGDIKKEQSWVFYSGATAILTIIMYFIIMSFLIFPSMKISSDILYKKSWGIGFYLFLIGGLILTFIGSRRYIKQINEELKKEIPEDIPIKKPKK